MLSGATTWSGQSEYTFFMVQSGFSGEEKVERLLSFSIPHSFSALSMGARGCWFGSYGC